MQTSLFLLLGVGCLGGWIGHWSGIPSGVLLGSLLAVIFFRLWGPEILGLPWSLKFVGQVLIGVLIGVGFHRDMLTQLQKLWLPVVLSAVILMVVGILVALLLVRLQWLDLATSYLSTSPGAMTALVTTAVDTGAAAPIVVLFHFTRILLVIFSAPLILRLLQAFV